MTFLATRAIFVLLVVVAAGQSRVVKRSDDVELGTLSDVVEQQANAIQQLQAEVLALQALKTKVDDLSTKESKTVAFSVRYSSDDSENGISLGANPVLLFDQEITNIGQGYDTLTGMFTAPVAGTYAFFLTEMAPNQHGSLFLDIMREKDVLDETWAPGSADVNDQGGASLVTTHLEAGQRVWVRHHYGDAVRGLYNTIFTGFLFHAD